MERVLFLKGFFLFFIITALVNLFPFKYYAFLLRKTTSNKSAKHNITRLMNLTKKTIHRIERFSPLRSTCLIKSILFKLLISKLGVNSKLTISLKKNITNQLIAHAYVKVDNNYFFLYNNQFKNIVYSI